MAFNRPFMALFVLCSAAACGKDTTRRDVLPGGGVPPESVNSVSLASSSNTLVTVERQGATITQFSVDPFAAVAAAAIPLGESNDTVLTSTNAAYYLVASAAEFAFMKADGSNLNANPVSFSGNIQSAALSPNLNVAALFDDQQNAALFVLDANGNVQASWTTNSAVASGEYWIAPAMLASGKLALTLSGTDVAIVDIAASVKAQAWKATTFSVTGAVDLSWAAVIPGPSFNALMLQDGTRLVTVNADSGALVDQKALGSAAVLGRFRDASPFVVSQPLSEYSADKNDIIYAGSDAKLNTITVQRPTDGLDNSGATDQLTGAWLDTSAGTVALAHEPNASSAAYSRALADRVHPQWVERYHLSDASAVDTSQLNDWVHLALRSSYMVAVYPSALGSAARRTYGTSPTVTTLQNYDLSVATRRY